ncbi:MAG: LysR substrate-binding domain-containing protein, partial [Paracoccaceae bacterium]|nr:LysR substrate-binding domain-containing protein [Paracoccaceae bacterium]
APSVSRIISDLEEDLGVRLFNRTTRHVSLTEAGEEFLTRGSLILEEWESLRDHTASTHSSPKGRLRVSSALAFGTERIAPLAARFQDRYPEVKIELHISNRKVDLVYERFDVAIRIGGREGLDDSSMMARRIHSQHQIFAATPSYIERFGVPEDLEGLSQHRLIKQVSGSWGATSELLVEEEKVPWRLPDDFVVNAPTGARSAVRAGSGIALVAEYLVREDLAAGRLVRVLPEVRTTDQPIYAVFAHRDYVAAKIRTFVDFLVDELKE